jgi:hypothetical protein
MTATHAAAAFCQVNSRLLFRSTANGEMVTVEVKALRPKCWKRRPNWMLSHDRRKRTRKR